MKTVPIATYRTQSSTVTNKSYFYECKNIEEFKELKRHEFKYDIYFGLLIVFLIVMALGFTIKIIFWADKKK